MLVHVVSACCMSLLLATPAFSYCRRLAPSFRGRKEEQPSASLSFCRYIASPLPRLVRASSWPHTEAGSLRFQAKWYGIEPTQLWGNSPVAYGLVWGDTRLREHTLTEKRRPQRWTRWRLMAHTSGTSQRLGKRMKAAAKAGPQLSWSPCHWILACSMPRTVWRLSVHQSLHIKRFHAQASS